MVALAPELCFRPKRELDLDEMLRLAHEIHQKQKREGELEYIYSLYRFNDGTKKECLTLCETVRNPENPAHVLKITPLESYECRGRWLSPEYLKALHG